LFSVDGALTCHVLFISKKQEQVDFLIQEANRKLDDGNYGSAEFKASEGISTAKSKLGLEHPLVRSHPWQPVVPRHGPCLG